MQAHPDEVGKFRVHLPQCTTVPTVPLRHAAIDTAARSLQVFLGVLQSQLHAYWHDVGVPRHMQQCFEDLTHCWDLQQIVSRPPLQTHVDAFLRIVELVRPALQTFRWPAARKFSFVGHVWPEADVLAEQYVRLCKRLRIHYAKPSFKQLWEDEKGVLDESAVAASVACYPCLSWPAGPRKQHCWHAAFLLQHNRTLNAASASCERAGSLLHNLFSGDTRLSPVRVAARIRLRNAGLRCDGNFEDEQLVSDLSECLLSHGKSPFLSVSGRNKRKKRGESLTGPAVVKRARRFRTFTKLSNAAQTDANSAEKKENILLQYPKAKLLEDKQRLGCYSYI